MPVAISIRCDRAHRNAMPTVAVTAGSAFRPVRPPTLPENLVLPVTCHSTEAAPRPCRHCPGGRSRPASARSWSPSGCRVFLAGSGRRKSVNPGGRVAGASAAGQVVSRRKLFCCTEGPPVDNDLCPDNDYRVINDRCAGRVAHDAAWTKASAPIQRKQRCARRRKIRRRPA